MNPKLLFPDSFGQLYNVHPLFVHAPLAFLPGALLLFGAALWLRRDWLVVGARVCLALGTMGAFLAFTTGWLAEGSIPHNETIHSMMQTHKYTAVAVLIGAIALAVWSVWLKWERTVAKGIFFGLLVLLNLVLISVGDLGARMVYLEGVGVRPAAEVITGAPDPKPIAEEGQDEASHDHTH